ncbi:MAG: MerR family transcriptional regulator [Halanaerobiales bacterium]|nr:MerR family transcriptional regulator [Halanaerobiales bacterium]
MRVGEFSAKSGVTIDTLRYYDKIGLLTPNKENGQRKYCEEDLEKIKAITVLKKANFTLEEIKKILELDQQIEEGLKKGVHKIDVAQESLKMVKIKFQEVVVREKEIQTIKG